MMLQIKNNLNIGFDTLKDEIKATPMPNAFIYHRVASKGARDLTNKINSFLFSVQGEVEQDVAMRVLRPNSQSFKGKKGQVVVNWGNSVVEINLGKATVLNPPEIIVKSIDKLWFFQKQTELDAGDIIPEYTTSVKVAKKWFPADGSELENGYPVAFVRTLRRSSAGKGIEMLRSLSELDDNYEGSLLVRYIPKKTEWRIHMSKKQGLFFLQKKILKAGVDPDDVCWRIRNHKNGFIYANGDYHVHDVPDEVLLVAEKAFVNSGMDFGAIDVVHTLENKAYCLEINSAPGLVGRTLDRYAITIIRESLLSTSEEVPLEGAA